MARYWYIVPKSSVKEKEEIGDYKSAEDVTDFPRGVFLAYKDKGLVTGIRSEEEARRWLSEGVYNEKDDIWTKIPERVPDKSSH